MDVLVDPAASVVVTILPVIVRPSLPTLVATNLVIVAPLARKDEREAATSDAAAGPDTITVSPAAFVEVMDPPAERIEA